MCTMRRMILHCLLLVSLAAAVPNGRQKRHLSYLRDFLSSTFSGWRQNESPQITQIEPEYKLYQVPGFDNIIYKSVVNTPVIEQSVINQPGQVLKIEPIESFIGTNNPQDTLVAFQNVNNLLSTGIFHGQENNLLKGVMVPMISDLNLIPQQHFESTPVITETVQPLHDVAVVNPYELHSNLEQRVEPRFLYKQVETNVPLMQLTEQGTPEVFTQEFDGTPSLPSCADQPVEEIISLDTNPFLKPVMPIGLHRISDYPNAINRLPPSTLNEPMKVQLIQPGHANNAAKNKVPLKPTPVQHYVEPVHSNSTPSSKAQPVAMVTNKAVIPQTLNKSTTENKDIKQNNSNVPMNSKPVQDNVEPIRSNSTPSPKAQTVVMVTDKAVISQTSNKSNPESKNIKLNNSNVVLTANKEPVKPIASRYVYKQAINNNPNAFSMVKDGDHLITNISNDLPKLNQSIHNLPITTMASVVTDETKTEKPVEGLAKDKDSIENSSPRVPEEIPEKGTLAYYIYEHDRNNRKPFSDVETDKQKGNDELIRYVYIPSDYNKADETTTVTENNIVSADDDDIEVRVSHDTKKHVNHNDPKTYNMAKEDDDLKITASPLSSLHIQVNIDTTTVNAITVKSESATSSPASSQEEKVSKVSKEIGKVPLKSSAIVAPNSNYAYHQSNADGSSLHVHGNKDGIYVDVYGIPSSGRGDIPEE